MKLSIVILVALVAQSDAATLRGMAAAALPDPTCSSGLISLPFLAGDKQVQTCCAGYCGECSDYERCKSVKGQASENACCAKKLYEMRCGNAPANKCLKPCSESVPPCILDFEEPKMPEKGIRHAAQNCTTAVDKYRIQMDSAIKAGESIVDAYHGKLKKKADKAFKAADVSAKEEKKMDKRVEKAIIAKVEDIPKVVKREPTAPKIDIKKLVRKVEEIKDSKPEISINKIIKKLEKEPKIVDMPGPADLPAKAKSCADIHGLYNEYVGGKRSGAQPYLVQELCSGGGRISISSSENDWEFDIDEKDIKLKGKGPTGTVKGESGMYTIEWSNGRAYKFACADMSGVYTASNGMTIYLRQKGCKGVAGSSPEGTDWEYSVDELALNGGGVSCTAQGSPGKWALPWSNGITYRQMDAMNRIVGMLTDCETVCQNLAGDYKTWAPPAPPTHPDADMKAVQECGECTGYFENPSGGKWEYKVDKEYVWSGSRGAPGVIAKIQKYHDGAKAMHFSNGYFYREPAK